MFNWLKMTMSLDAELRNRIPGWMLICCWAFGWLFVMDMIALFLFYPNGIK